jgi:hypothetical protein
MDHQFEMMNGAELAYASCECTEVKTLLAQLKEKDEMIRQLMKTNAQLVEMMREVREDAKAMLDDAMNTPVKAHTVPVPSAPLKEPSARKRRLNMEPEAPQPPQASQAAQATATLPVGTMLRHHPVSVPSGSTNDHYTAIQVKDGVLQVKTPSGARPRIFFKTVDDWLATLPDQPAYEDLVIEYK